MLIRETATVTVIQGRGVAQETVVGRIPKPRRKSGRKGTRNRRTVRVTWKRKSKNGRKEEMCWRYQQRETWNTGCPLFLISTNLIILFYHDCLHVFLRVFLHIFLDVCPHTCLSK
jgi:hypothetical protein